MKAFTGFFLILAAIVLIVASQAFFVVDEREQAIVLQLGQPTGEIRQPGLHLKMPFVQDVRRFDSRILSVDPDPEQVVISSSFDSPLVKEAAGEGAVVERDNETSSGEPIIVDVFARYRIKDPLQFMKTLRTVDNAAQRIESIMNDSTRAILGQTTMRQLLSKDRTVVMADIKASVNRKISQDQLGIEVVDVRIVRADLTSALRQSTVQRMISELRERATETRAKGEERALEIRSTAEKERTILLASAQRHSQVTRGEGDNEAIKIYAEAFNKDPEFYQFNRSMEAYRRTLANPETRLMLSPDSGFLRYLKNVQ